MHWLDLFILAVATWRLSYMLTAEPGPFRVFDCLRAHDRTGVTKCLYCTSVWVAVVLVGIWSNGRVDHMAIIYILAVSGLAIMLKHYTGAGFNG